MSGGSHDYLYYHMKELFVGDMHDAELDELMEDICKLCHDLEWWRSGDYGEDTYRMTAQAFKKKWLYGNRDYRLCQNALNQISSVCSRLRKDISIVDPYGDSEAEHDDFDKLKPDSIDA